MLKPECYKGTINIIHKNMQSIYSAKEKFLLQWLSQVYKPLKQRECEAFIKGNVNGISEAAEMLTEGGRHMS